VAHTGVPPEELGKLPVLVYHLGKSCGQDEDAKCSICLCDFSDGVKIRELRCMHLFHKDCIDT
jgi:hypothetical protein